LYEYVLNLSENMHTAALLHMHRRTARQPHTAAHCRTALPFNVHSLRILTSDAAYKDAVLVAGALPVLVDLLHSGSDRGKENAAVALSNLASDYAANTAVIMVAHAVPPLVELLRGGSIQGKEKAARVRWNLASSEAANRVAIITAGALPHWWSCCAAARTKAGRRP
jgi:hypothetical protein